MGMAKYALGLFLALLLNVAQTDATECSIQTKGVNHTLKEVIVNKHNELRSKVATGQEPGFPRASDMLELVWDDKLAEMSQKWASKCVLVPDPLAARQTVDGYAGQNFAFASNQNESPDWEEFFDDIYKEIKDFKCQALQKFVQDQDQKTSRFTQMIWAKTYKVGCGYVRFQKGKNFTHLYGCNYLPNGNVINKPIYEFGKPCSKCGGCRSIDGLCINKPTNKTENIEEENADGTSKSFLGLLMTAERGGTRDTPQNHSQDPARSTTERAKTASSKNSTKVKDEHEEKVQERKETHDTKVITKEEKEENVQERSEKTVVEQSN